MVSKLDRSVGEVITALKRRGMLDNSIIVFLADNGAPTMGIYANRGSNYPLRGVSFCLLIYIHENVSSYRHCNSIFQF